MVKKKLTKKRDKKYNIINMTVNLTPLVTNPNRTVSIALLFHFKKKNLSPKQPGPIINFNNRVNSLHDDLSNYIYF